MSLQIQAERDREKEREGEERRERVAALFIKSTDVLALGTRWRHTVVLNCSTSGWLLNYYSLSGRNYWKFHALLKSLAGRIAFSRFPGPDFNVVIGTWNSLADDARLLNVLQVYGPRGSCPLFLRLCEYWFAFELGIFRRLLLSEASVKTSWKEKSVRVNPLQKRKIPIRTLALNSDHFVSGNILLPLL